MSQIINKTSIPASLDVATSGAIPPNPSELLISDKNKQFIEDLKKVYDFCYHRLSSGWFGSRFF